MHTFPLTSWNTSLSHNLKHFITYLQESTLLFWWPDGKMQSKQRGCWLAKTNIYEQKIFIEVFKYNLYTSRVPVSGIKAGIGGLNTCKNGGASPILPRWEVKELEVFAVKNSSHLSTGVHPRLEGSRASGLQTPQNGNIKNTDFGSRCKGLCDLPFRRNQPLKLAGNW
jgi:hypothetical protein